LAELNPAICGDIDVMHLGPNASSLPSSLSRISVVQICRGKKSLVDVGPSDSLVPAWDYQDWKVGTASLRIPQRAYPRDYNQFFPKANNLLKDKDPRSPVRMFRERSRGP